MKTPGETFIVSIRSDSNEARLEGAMISAEESVGLSGLERVISLRARQCEPMTPQARIDHASALLSAVGVDNPEEHHILSSESELSVVVDTFMAKHRTLGADVSFDIPDQSIGHIPAIARKFGVISADELPGQYI